MAITDEQVERLKAENPGKELHILESPQEGIEVVVCKPPEAEWRRFRALQSDDEQKAGSLRQLLFSCIVYPKDQLGAILQAHPGLAETFGGKLVKIAGVDPTATSRKL